MSCGWRFVPDLRSRRRGIGAGLWMLCGSASTLSLGEPASSGERKGLTAQTEDFGESDTRLARSYTRSHGSVVSKMKEAVKEAFKTPLWAANGIVTKPRASSVNATAPQVPAGPPAPRANLNKVVIGADGRYEVTIGGRTYRATRKRDLNKYLRA